MVHSAWFSPERRCCTVCRIPTCFSANVQLDGGCILIKPEVSDNRGKPSKKNRQKSADGRILTKFGPNVDLVRGDVPVLVRPDVSDNRGFRFSGVYFEQFS